MYKGEKERNKYHVERSGNTVIYYSYKNYSNITSTKLQIRISFFLFPFHVTEPMISSNILYLLLTIHKKFLLLSSWTLVYFTHHLFYNEYIYIFFFFPSSFFRISQRFRLIDGKMIYCCGEHPRADNASPLYERCTHIMLRCRDPK